MEKKIPVGVAIRVAGNEDKRSGIIRLGRIKEESGDICTGSLFSGKKQGGETAPVADIIQIFHDGINMAVGIPLHGLFSRIVLNAMACAGTIRVGIFDFVNSVKSVLDFNTGTFNGPGSSAGGIKTGFLFGREEFLIFFS